MRRGAGEEIQNPYISTFSVLTVVVNAEKKTVADKPVTNKPVAEKPVVDQAGSTKKPTAAELQIQRLQASIERGAQIYQISCIPCHGLSGSGDGVVSKRGFPPPPPLTTGKSALMKDGQLFHILTYGQGSMSPMVAQLSRDRRWDVINFVRDMQHRAPKSAKSAPVTAIKPNQSSDTKEAKQ